MSIAEAVTRGAEWLDLTFPGWERRIDPETLDLNNACQCILGQVIGLVRTLEGGVMDGYIATRGAVSRFWMVAHGFSAFEQPYNYRDLTATWLELIKERFDDGILSDMEE